MLAWCLLGIVLVVGVVISISIIGCGGAVGRPASRHDVAVVAVAVATVSIAAIAVAVGGDVGAGHIGAGHHGTGGRASKVSLVAAGIDSGVGRFAVAVGGAASRGSDDSASLWSLPLKEATLQRQPLQALDRVWQDMED